VQRKIEKEETETGGGLEEYMDRCIYIFLNPCNPL
jgi:hypothetical protein